VANKATVYKAFQPL